ncbi:unnamed protein product [Phaedon cochleariae]|uniref:BPL/LPL catalytic domain-containing protein n=1 Tax=Phaedon cochleariae TaxID=80249 RepID=A0A9N9SAB6_PHACE|nr:unnamed protein product [Phaedon cochleariae]
MILTFFYMYATFLQWWRLGALKNKLKGTLNASNALLVCDDIIIYETKKSRSFENLLFRSENRVGCTVVPKQKINLSQWLTFPADFRHFPIHFENRTPNAVYPKFHVIIQAMLDTYIKHSADLLEVENFGELIAWRASEGFEVILKTDLDRLSKLVNCFSQGDLDINHELKLLRIETVDVEGVPTKIKYDQIFSKDYVLKYSYSAEQWQKFAETVKQIYAKIRDTTPKITIENGKLEETRKVPVSEVKPMKKDGKKTEDKNTLEVAAGDYRRHKTNDHKRDKNSERHSRSVEGNSKLKEEPKLRTTRTDKDARKEESRRDDSKTRKDEAKSLKTKTDKEEVKPSKSKDDQKKYEAATEKEEITIVNGGHSPKVINDQALAKSFEEKEAKPSKIKPDDKHKKEARSTSKTRKEDPDTKTHKKDEKSWKSSKPAKEKSNTEAGKSGKTLSKRSTSSEKKLIKSTAICDETDADGSTKKADEEYLKIDGAQSNGHGKKVPSSSKTVKPPNILVYADSPVAKENVKSAISSMLNKEKYTIYDLPTDPTQNIWNDSTVLVVVCGNVPPNLTFHLLQYLVTGGQLLCLCSDFLYSVLHTFTTAEVREHELVRFTYGKWAQVKMMHHIFCYQASPAKKQFSKDSDHSQSSGNGSSPIAPRTPSAVEIQHNGKEYIIQVQILGTEETWQTPSLLLASVKGGDGRAIFSQVHLEINPNQFEEDETKFQALKESDSARMEILKDILSNRLDIDCSTGMEIAYTPAYFLGRHEMKLKLLNDCDSIKDNKLECEKVVLKFCGKDVIPGEAASNLMPVLIHSCPSNFSTVKYFEALETEHIGRLVIYSDVMASSHNVVAKTLAHGLVVIPRQQTQGVGRSNNVWISPIGCAMFSMQLHISRNSVLGKYLPLAQQIGMVAVASALKSIAGSEDLDIGLKWPNDLYANGSVKIGGLLTTSAVLSDVAIVNLGCGINLDNGNPTLCVNDMIRTSNETKGTSMKKISYEAYFAAVFNETEKIMKIVQGGDIDYLYDLYYKYWLHNDSEVMVTTKDGKSEKVRIVGIDDYGFLRVRTPTGKITTVHSDGNTFDMLKGLIFPKTF